MPYHRSLFLFPYFVSLFCFPNFCSPNFCLAILVQYFCTNVLHSVQGTARIDATTQPGEREVSFLKKIFQRKLDAEKLATASDAAEFGQIHLLSRFQETRPLDDPRQQAEWERILPRSYRQQIALFVDSGLLQEDDAGYQTTPAASPALELYAQRQAQAKAQAMEAVRTALAQRDSSEALALRRQYEAAQPLGAADWTGPEPQLSHSALTRRILFLDHRLLDGLSPQAEQWLKLYAAEQHLWGARWRLEPGAIPPEVAEELATDNLSAPEAAYWRAYGLGLFVENQDTWQRCKGGDHVRRIALQGPDDEHTCDFCRGFYGEQFLVVRVPELPHRDCSAGVGCRCEYVPVLETYDEQ